MFGNIWKSLDFLHLQRSDVLLICFDHSCSMFIFSCKILPSLKPFNNEKLELSYESRISYLSIKKIYPSPIDVYLLLFSLSSVLPVCAFAFPILPESPNSICWKVHNVVKMWVCWQGVRLKQIWIALWIATLRLRCRAITKCPNLCQIL